MRGGRNCLVPGGRLHILIGIDRSLTFHKEERTGPDVSEKRKPRIFNVVKSFNSAFGEYLASIIDFLDYIITC